MNNYFLFLNETIHGPISAQVLEGMLNAGTISPDTPTAPEGSSEWTTAGQLFGNLDQAAPPPPPSVIPGGAMPYAMYSHGFPPPKSKSNWVWAAPIAALGVVAALLAFALFPRTERTRPAAARPPVADPAVTSPIVTSPSVANPTPANPPAASPTPANPPPPATTDPALELSKRAEAGDAKAQYELGRTYRDKAYTPLGEPHESQEMFRWFKKSADQGHSGAQYELANCYSYGKGVAKDCAQSLGWYRKAAAQGVNSACLFIGHYYKDGEGVPKDAAEAAKWFRKGSKGDVSCLHALSKLYLEGDDGVPKDLVKALMYLDLILVQSGAGAFKTEVQKERDSCAKDMTPDQIAEAKRLASEWKPEASPQAVQPAPTETPVATTALPIHRVLTDTSGRKLDATILEISATDIRCIRAADGLEFSIALAKLSAGDRKFLAELDQPTAATQTAKVVTPPPPTVAPPKPMPPVIAQLPFKPAAPPKPAIPSELAIPPLPATVSPANYRLHLSSGKSVAATLLGADADKIYFRGPERFLAAVPLSELAAEDRVFISLWLAGIRDQPSLSRTFTIEGKPVLARAVKTDKESVSLVQNDGTLHQKLPWQALAPADQQFLKAWQEKKWLNLGWEWLVKPQFSAARPFNHSGTAWARSKGKWGLINRNGEFIVAPAYEEASELSEHGCFKVKTSTGWGVIDSQGTILANPEWDEVQDAIHGRIPVRKNGKWGYVGESRELVIACNWDDAWRFSSAGTAVVTLAGKLGLIDRIGNILLNPEWDGILNPGADGRGAVRKNKDSALIDQNGTLLSRPDPRMTIDWETCWRSRRPELGLIPTRTHGLVGNDGKWVIEPKDWLYFSNCAAGFLLSDETGSKLVGKGGEIIAKASGGFLRTENPDEPIFQEGRAIAIHKGEGGKLQYGSIDLTGKMIIPYSDSQLTLFSEGLSAVKDHAGKWGYLNHDGKAVIAAQWDEAKPFCNGTARVRSGANWGFIDSSGKILIEPKWSEAGDFADGLAAVRPGGDANGAWQFIRVDGSNAFPGKKGYRFLLSERFKDPIPKFRMGLVPAVKPGGKDYVLIDPKGQERWVSEYNLDYRESEPNLPVGISRHYLGSRNYRNRFGNYKSEWALHGSDGKCVISGVTEDFEVGTESFPWSEPTQYGLMDLTGKILVEPKWDRATILTESLVEVAVNGRSGLVDSQGKSVLEPEWNDISFLDNGIICARTSTQKQHFWPDGRPLIPAELKDATIVDTYGDDAVLRRPMANNTFEWILCERGTGQHRTIGTDGKLYWNSSLSKYGLLWIEDASTKRWSLINRNGNPLGHFSETKPSAWFFDEGFGVGTRDSGKIHINPEGKAIVGPISQDAGLFSHGLAAVKRNGKWGFINSQGRLVIPCQWEQVRRFYSAPGVAGAPVTAAVMAPSGKWGFITIKGKTIGSIEWDEVGARFMSPDRKHWLANVKKDNQWGLINPQGSLVVQPVGEEPAWVRDGGYYLRAKQYDVWDYTPDGKPMISRSAETELEKKLGLGAGELSGAGYGLFWHFENSGAGPKGTSGYRLLDSAGKVISKGPWIEPLESQDSYSFAQGLLVCTGTDGKSGLMNQQGKVLLPPTWQTIRWIGPGVAAVWNADTGGLWSAAKGFIHRDTPEIRFSRFGSRKSVQPLFPVRSSCVVIETQPVWGYARLNR